MHTTLALEHAVRVAALDDERRRGDAGLLSFLRSRRSRPRSPSCWAQRVNMRSTICAQSCASVPPAPECTSQIASRSSCSPLKSARSSSVEVAPRDRRASRDLRLDRVVVFLARELEQRLHVGDAASRSSISSTSSRTAESSPLTLRARSGSSQRSGARRLLSSSTRRRAGFVDAEVMMRLANTRRATISQVLGEIRAFNARGRACTSCRSRRSTARCGRASSRPAPAACTTACSPAATAWNPSSPSPHQRSSALRRHGRGDRARIPAPDPSARCMTRCCTSARGSSSTTTWRWKT